MVLGAVGEVMAGSGVAVVTLFRARATPQVAIRTGPGPRGEGSAPRPTPKFHPNLKQTTMKPQLEPPVVASPPAPGNRFSSTS